MKTLTKMAKIIITFRGTETERENFNTLTSALQTRLKLPVSEVILKALTNLKTKLKIK